jgi:putative hydrolase of the HAD superfamily
VIKAVIFDFGGVMVNIANSGSVNDIAKALGEDGEEFRKIHSPVLRKFASGELNEEEYWQKLSEATGKPRPQNWYELWREKAKQNTCLRTEMVKFVDELKQQGIRCILLSNSIPPHEEIARERGWYKSFDSLYFSIRTGFYKPDIKAYENVLKSEGLRAEECVFVDDTKANLVPARQLGIKTILAISPAQIIAEVRQGVEKER